MTAGAASWVGQRLVSGRYHVVAKLGEGGMGHVYRARDGHLGSDVVIKVPRRSLLMEDPGFAARFSREIRSLVALSHPHIVKILDVGQHDGLPFAVMQYLGGGSLEQRRPVDQQGRPRPIRPDQLKGWLEHVAQALDFIHARGYVHRDVKPANILFDRGGNAYLSDFGIAKALATQAESAGTGALTGTGFVLGTPEYLAPEIILGNSFDGRADQYALAVVVYELLAGRRPFEGANPSAVLVKHSTAPPVSLDQVAPAVSTALAAVVSRALAKAPEGRFSDCASFVRAVVEASGGTAPHVPPTRPGPGAQPDYAALPDLMVDADPLGSVAAPLPTHVGAARRRRRPQQAPRRQAVKILGGALAGLALGIVLLCLVFGVRLFGGRSEDGKTAQRNTGRAQERTGEVGPPGASPEGPDDRGPGQPASAEEERQGTGEEPGAGPGGGPRDSFPRELMQFRDQFQSDVDRWGSHHAEPPAAGRRETSSPRPGLGSPEERAWDGGTEAGGEPGGDDPNPGATPGGRGTGVPGGAGNRPSWGGPSTSPPGPLGPTPLPSSGPTAVPPGPLGELLRKMARISMDREPVRSQADEMLQTFRKRGGASGISGLLSGSGTVEALFSEYRGQLDGATIVLYPNGFPKLWIEYRRGKKSGSIKSWQEDGQPEYYGEFQTGQRHGLCCLYQEGQPKLLVAYEHNEPVEIVLVSGGQAVKRLEDAAAVPADSVTAGLWKRLEEVESRLQEEERDLKQRKREASRDARRARSARKSVQDRAEAIERDNARRRAVGERAADEARRRGF